MKYVIIINSIVSMGGGQQYCSNKVKELKERGYDVCVISSFSGKVILEQLKCYEKNIVPHLKYPPYCYSARKREKVIETVERIIGDIDDSTIIDTSSVSYAEWGEIIAKRHNCKHVCYFIDEMFSVNKSDVEYLKFKYDRNELFGTSNKTMNQLFKGYYDMPVESSHAFKAYCTNVIDDVSNSTADIMAESENINIVIFGRLDKPYIEPSARQLVPFLYEHSNERFNIVFVGPSSRRITGRLKKIFKQQKNVNLFFTGALVPVPEKLVSATDVCISSAGSALVFARENIPTVYMNATDGNVVGILEYTLDVFKEDLRYGNKSEDNIQSILNKILFEKYCENNKKKFSCSDEDDFDILLKSEIDKQLDNVIRLKERVYYDVESNVCLNKTFKFIKLLISVFGVKTVDFLIFKIKHGI